MTEGDFVKVLRLAALPLPLVAHGFGADTALDPYVQKAARSLQVHHRGARDSGHGAVPALPTQARG